MNFDEFQTHDRRLVLLKALENAQSPSSRLLATIRRDMDLKDAVFQPRLRNEEILNEFRQSNAYSVLLIELISDEDFAATFFNSIMTNLPRTFALNPSDHQRDTKQNNAFYRRYKCNNRTSIYMRKTQYL